MPAMLRDRSPHDRTGLTGEVLVPRVEGIHAFARGDYRGVIERIDPVRARVIDPGVMERRGGSWQSAWPAPTTFGKLGPAGKSQLA